MRGSSTRGEGEEEMARQFNSRNREKERVRGSSTRGEGEGEIARQFNSRNRGRERP